MRMLATVLLVLVAGTAAAAAPSPPLSGARSYRSCAGAGPYWPTQTLALTGGIAWIACKEEQRLVRLTLPGARSTSIRLGGQPKAVLAAFGAIWVLDTAGTVSRIDPRTNRVAGRVRAGSAALYNLWAGAGSLWSADDQGSHVVRIDPARLSVTARIAVGDGPSDLVFGPGRAWVINHRDRVLSVLDTAKNEARQLTVVPGDTPERIALHRGSLWLTGRGTDLIELDPDTGAVRRTIEIGAGGIDVVAAAGSLWVPARTAAVDRRGFPTLGWLRRIDPASGRVTTPARATRRVDVHGLVPYRSGVLVADNTGGFLYSVPR